MKRLEGKVALVTGGARGIGRAICEAYAAEGAKVAVADLLEDDAKATAQALWAQGMAVTMNVTDLESIAKGVAAVEQAWGGIDILVNNAGIFNMASIDKVTHEDYRRQYDVNVGGAIFAIQAVVPSMKKRGGGAIINFASQAGRRGEPNVTIYCSTKAAVISVTQSLALELAGEVFEGRRLAWSANRRAKGRARRRNRRAVRSIAAPLAARLAKNRPGRPRAGPSSPSPGARSAIAAGESASQGRRKATQRNPDDRLRPIDRDTGEAQFHGHVNG